MKLDPEAAAISADKHIFGPRAGVLVGLNDTISKIRASALEFGYEAQVPTLVSVYRGLKNHDKGTIRTSVKLADQLNKKIYEKFPNKFYFVNDCVGLTDEGVIKLLTETAGKKISIVPQEACSAISMLLLEKYAMVTVSAVAAPGAAPYLRLVTWPDGYRISTDKIVEAVSYSFDKLSEIASDESAVRKMIMG